MKLEKICLHNLFQYENLEISFRGNLIGIIGGNGVGKSNFLNSLHFAFAGEVPGKTKEQVLRWGTDSGYAIVEFEHLGKKGRLERHTPGTKASFKYGDDVSVSGIRAVNAAVLEMLGMDKDVFRLVFVKQAELDAILFDQASRREVAFQRMCGLGEANRLHKNLTDLIQQVFRETAGDLDATIATLEAEKKSSAEELAGHKAELAKLVAEAGEDPDGTKSRLEAERDRFKSLQNLKFALQGDSQALEQAERECADLEKQLADLGTTVKRDIVEKAKLELSKAESELGKHDMLAETRRTTQARLDANRLSVRMAEDDVTGQNAMIEPLEAKIAGETQALANAKVLYDMYRAALAVCSHDTGGVCPVCGAPMTTRAEDYIQAKLAEISPADLDNHRVTRMQQDLAAQRRKATELAGKLSSLLASISDDAKWLETHPCPDTAALEKERTYVVQMREFVQDISAKCDKAEQLSWRIRTLSSDIGSRKNDRKTVQERLEALHDNPETSWEECAKAAEALNGQIADYSDLLARIQVAQAVISSLERRILGINTSLKDAQAKKANSETREQAYRTLSKVADWLHYSNGPHKLAVRIMDDLTDGTNKFLETLDAPFSVQVDPETLGYLFTMNNGTGPDAPQPADALSGGQKVLLAVAFRLASYCMFAGKYGLMALDEPTAYLDDANVSNFCTLLESLKATAVSMDLQILISTHERAVLPCMDSVLDIDEEKK